MRYAVDLFVRYCIAGVWHRVDFRRPVSAWSLYTQIAKRLVPSHCSAVEYHDSNLPAPVVTVAKEAA